jgi:hypothetical protein
MLSPASAGLKAAGRAAINKSIRYHRYICNKKVLICNGILGRCGLYLRKTGEGDDPVGEGAVFFPKERRNNERKG